MPRAHCVCCGKVIESVCLVICCAAFQRYLCAVSAVGYFPAAIFFAVQEDLIMSMIKVEGLTFAYPKSYDNIFENVTFQIDTDWKLGFVGRNVPRYEQKTLSIT